MTYRQSHQRHDDTFTMVKLRYLELRPQKMSLQSIKSIKLTKIQLMYKVRVLLKSLLYTCSFLPAFFILKQKQHLTCYFEFVLHDIRSLGDKKSILSIDTHEIFK